MNAFVIQFLPQYPADAFKNLADPEAISLEGLSIIIMTHDSDSDQSKNVQTYFATYRYFQSQMDLKRDYLNVIFQKRGFLKRSLRKLRFLRDQENDLIESQCRF